MAIGAVVGAVVLSALLYLIWRWRRQSPKGMPLNSQRNSHQGRERLARFSHANPLLRGKQPPKPPSGSPPKHAMLSFEEMHSPLKVGRGGKAGT